jgi:hypothetical protein
VTAARFSELFEKPPATIGLILAIAAFVNLLLLLVTIICLRRAPLGYEDESGFHFGAPAENPSTARIVEMRPGPIGVFRDRDFFGSMQVSMIETNEPQHG